MSQDTAILPDRLSSSSLSNIKACIEISSLRGKASRIAIEMERQTGVIDLHSLRCRYEALSEEARSVFEKEYKRRLTQDMTAYPRNRSTGFSTRAALKTAIREMDVSNQWDSLSVDELLGTSFDQLQKSVGTVAIRGNALLQDGEHNLGAPIASHTPDDSQLAGVRYTFNEHTLLPNGTGVLPINTQEALATASFANIDPLLRASNAPDIAKSSQQPFNESQNTRDIGSTGLSPPIMTTSRDEPEPACGSDEDPKTWWPAMMAKQDENGVLVCTNCALTVNDMKPPTKKDALRRHIFDCIQRSVADESLPNVVGRFNQIQSCPICPVSISAVSSKLGVHGSFKKTAQGWAMHLHNFHNEVEGHLCTCGHVFQGPLSKVRMHLAETHRIWASGVGHKVTKDAALAAENFPLPWYCLIERSWFADPIEWEHHCEDIFQATIVDAAEPSGYDSREDLGHTATPNFKTGIEDLDEIITPPHDSILDTRFVGQIARENASVPVCYGYCVFCVFDRNMTFTERLQSHTSHHSLRRHVMAHLVNLWSNENPQWRLPRKRASGSSSSSTTIPDNAGQSAHYCPVEECPFAEVELPLWRLSNHIFIHHAAFTPSTSIGFGVSKSQENFGKNLAKYSVIYKVGSSSIEHSGLLRAYEDAQDSSCPSAEESEEEAGVSTRVAQSASTKVSRARKRAKQSKAKAKGKGKAKA